jgi:1-phosphofructokinase family hexose kinase
LIVTLTVNPAIDRTISVDHLAFEDRAYIDSTRESAGGRGINSSHVIHSFGGQTVAVLTSGGKAGRRLRRLLNDCGYPVRVAPVKNETRTNLTITDQHGLTVNLNEKGPEIAKSEVAGIESVVRECMEGADWLLVCGSMPPGVPASFYGKLIAQARKRKVKTLLHTSGDALREGIKSRPTVATPNQSEAERLLGRSLLMRSHYLEAAREIREMGPESVVLSLASRGAVAAFADGLYEAIPPPIAAVCPIGSGDALTAAYAWRMAQPHPNNAEALRWGVAAGTASALLPGMNLANLKQTSEMYRQVEVRRAGVSAF